MLHRTLLASPPPPPLAVLLSSMHSLAYTPRPPVAEQRAMEAVALKRSLRPEQQQLQQLQQQQSHGVFGEEGNGWGFGEKGSVLGEGFSVDELLNLGDFGDANDKDDDLVKAEEATEAANSTSSSALSFDAAAAAPPLAGISLPAHDAADLEWVSYIIDDTLADFPAQKAPPLAPKPADSTPKNAPPAQELPTRAKRSKRGRAAADAWSKATAAASPTSSSASSCLIYDHAAAAAAADQSMFLYDTTMATAAHAKKQKPKKRGRKPKDKSAPFPSAASIAAYAAAAAAGGERRCSHCGVSKTPQWRAGPMGAKTLCNACGVRFKSGRLLPEYRPACSPTFESSLHSNSHRKVLEMRRKKENELAGPAEKTRSVSGLF